jgi:hypothetical protein
MLANRNVSNMRELTSLSKEESAISIGDDVLIDDGKLKMTYVNQYREFLLYERNGIISLNYVHCSNWQGGLTFRGVMDLIG